VARERPLNEAKTTWALVVGIDEYEDPRMRKLTGAVGDAIAAVGWLRKLGVPPDQILLHAAPTAASAPALKKLLAELQRPSYLGTTVNDIWASVYKLTEVRGGTRLFIFLCGHGLYDPQNRRMFLTREFGVNGAETNLTLDAYFDCFLSMGFARQFLFFDGCQNLPYSERSRPIIPAMGPLRAGYTAKAGNSLVACYAAALDQLAAEIDARGAFLRVLLPAMDPDAPYLPAVDLDFSKGERTLDLWKLMHEYVAPKVQQDAGALAPPVIETPIVEPRGTAANARGSLPVYRLPEMPTSNVELVLEPADAATAVRTLRVSVDDEPFWDWIIPPGPPAAVPQRLAFKLPAGASARAVCRVQDNAAWDIETAVWELKADVDQVRPFRFLPRQPVPAAPPPPTRRPGLAPRRGVGPPRAGGRRPERAAPLTERYEVKTYGPDGGLVPAVGGRYDEIARRVGLPATPADGAEIEPGVRITYHEIGPSFDVDQSALLRGRDVATAWAGAVRELVPANVAVLTSLPGDVAPRPAPNLRVLMPPGGSKALAGVQVNLGVLAIGPPADVAAEPVWRQGDGLSLARVEQEPMVRVEPGPARVRLDLPWGSWTHVVRASAVGETPVQLPESIGTPPLRVALHAQLHEPGGTIMGTPTDEGFDGAPAGSVRQGISARKRARLVRGKQQAGSGRGTWMLRIPAAMRDAKALTPPIVALEGQLVAQFPITPDRALAVERSAGGLRVEPISDFPAPEWDLLVATGRLDALSAEDAVHLTDQKWFDEILGLAGAYAVYAAQNWPYLDVVINNLSRLPHAGLDSVLLRIASIRSRGAPLPPEAIARLASLARYREVPLLRWGVPLALEIIRAVPANRALRSWRSALERIERGLSPISVWTAWLE
jgi:hypothetical protein